MSILTEVVPCDFKQARVPPLYNSGKGVRWSAVPLPCPSWLCLKLRGERGSGPKGSMTYAFIHGQIPASRPKSQHRSSTPSGPLPCSPLNFNHNLLWQGTGTADHLTLLRLLSLKFAFSGLKSSLLRLQILAFSPLRSRISSWISN